MTRLLIATNNPDKLEEYQEILAPLSLALTHLSAEGITLEPEETGTTFQENAVIKATAFARASGLLTLADDSGLEVDALNGEPGVYSARYGNTAKDDHVGRCHLVLQQLAAKNTPWPERTARFRCVIALADKQDLIGIADGTVEGYIDYSLKGTNGFGYDPIFFVPDFNQTLGQVSSSQKHSISHRGRAGRAATQILQQYLARSLSA
jgi:XTP/dITP diphosphohydrolase